MENTTGGGDKISSSDFFCLMRVGRNSDWLHLPEDSPTSVGRGVTVNYQLLSRSCPLMISRMHCTIYPKSGQQWTIVDNQTVNGVWVNGKRIPAFEDYPIQLGDSVQIGVPLNGNEAEFNYVLAQRQPQDITFCMTRRTGETVDNQENLKRKRTTVEDEPSTSQPKRLESPPVDRPCPLSVKRRRLMKRVNQLQELEKQQDVDRPLRDTNSTSDLEQLQMYSKNIVILKGQVALLEGKHRRGGILREEQVTEEPDLLESIRTKMGKMEKLEKSFGESKKQLEERKTERLEEKLKCELEDALQEQNKVMQELLDSRQSLEDMLLAKNKELEKEKEKAKAQKEEVVTQVTEVLENELQCVICSELLIQTCILNCAHSFCSHCINQWRSRKSDCPICRIAIRSQTRCLALDNCIDSMVENLSADIKERRQTIINERNAARL